MTEFYINILLWLDTFVLGKFNVKCGILRRRQWHPTPVLLPGKSHGRRSLVGCSPRVAKSRTRLSDFTFTFHFPALEKEVAAHSGVLAWRIPGTGEPGGLPSMGSHRVRHDWSNLAAAVMWNEMEFLLPSLIWLTSDLPDYGISHFVL